MSMVGIVNLALQVFLQFRKKFKNDSFTNLHNKNISNVCILYSMTETEIVSELILFFYWLLVILFTCIP